MYRLITLHLYPAQTQKQQNRFLNSYIKLLTYRHPIVRFLQKTRAWSKQGNYKTDLAEVSGPIRTIWICSDINYIFLSVNDGVFG